jgi:hypothetical protein
MTTITIQVDTNSEAELVEAKALLDRLVGLGPRRGSGTETMMGIDRPNSSGDRAKRAVDDLLDRVGDSQRELVATAAAIDGTFSMADLAEKLNEDVSKIVSRFANLGRSLNRTRERVPGAPKFFVEEKKTDAGWTFTMPQPIRDAVKQKVADDRKAS